MAIILIKKTLPSTYLVEQHSGIFYLSQELSRWGRRFWALSEHLRK